MQNVWVCSNAAVLLVAFSHAIIHHVAMHAREIVTHAAYIELDLAIVALQLVL
jgi:hypothetical protein